MRSPERAYLLEGERGHRRGVVLGLTMAEIMLLLLFCLLLVAGALLQDREREIAEVQSRVDALSALGEETMSRVDLEHLLNDQAELQILREERDRWLELVSSTAGQDVDAAIPDETWRELVAAQELGQTMIERNITLVEVERLVDDQAELQRLRGLIAAREVGQTISTFMEAVGLARPGETSSPIVPDQHDWPPIITLGSDEFRFVTNSAELSSDFQRRLETDIAQQVRELLDQYDVDVIEVVGHTDEQPIRSTQQSTLDIMAIPVLNGEVPVTELVPADNAGLGLARAIAVANVLAEALGTAEVKIVPLSGAQLILPGDVLSDGLDPGDDRDRRRIELRVRRSDEGGND